MLWGRAWCAGGLGLWGRDEGVGLGAYTLWCWDPDAHGVGGCRCREQREGEGGQ